ncbi:hypothetical protein CHAZLY21_116 [Vibrio phage Chazly21]|nr:hypothetical protein CHAZLY21_116 [Vibrio phage Chazly21]
MSTMIIAGVSAVVLAVLFIILALVRTVVPANEVHILQTARKTTSYGKGQKNGNVYFDWPASIPLLGNVVTTLPVSVFSVDLHSYEAYDSDRLPFVVDVTAFFRIEDSNTAAQRVSDFHELREQLEAILQGATRTILAGSTIEEIMQGRSEYGDKFTAEVNGQLAEWGVQTVKNIELMDIRDANSSNVISNIMAKKKSEIEKDSRIEVANNKRAAEIAETENMREAELAAQEAQQQVGIRTAEKNREIGLAKEVAEQAVQESAKITAEREMEVKRVKDTQAANIAKQVTQTKAEENKIEVELNAQAAKAKIILEADAKLAQDTKLAEGTKIKADADAEQIRLTGEAKAEAAKKLELASVEPQIVLAHEIGENEGYQSYLIEIRKVEADENVGLEQAKALQTAEMKVIANSGDVNGGVNSLMNLLTPDGGTKMAGSLEALAQSDVGQAFLTKIGFDMVNKQ